LIDRPIRPLFPEGFYNEVQVICTLLSHDRENDPDIVSMVGASAALTISGIPFFGPIGGARVGYKDGNYLLNPTKEQLAESDLDLVVAGTKSSVLMVESEASELTEEVMLGAVMHGHKEMQPVIDMIISMAEQCAKDPWELEEKQVNEELQDKIKDLAEADLRKAYAITKKQDRVEAVDAAKTKVKEALITEDAEDGLEKEVFGLFKTLEKDIVRGGLIDTKQRIDGRGPADIRQIEVEVDVLPKVHGSALFTRGETQALVIATLGTGQDQQLIDAIDGDYKEPFMLHYNFPPYSVGEASFLRAPGRREIGHGKLAWRSVKALLPGEEEFPYTIRLVSEITESNGSSSMATVCGSSLAMMDAGVPVKTPVAGIAMGLIKEGENFVVLSDIMGDEDHLGDMDFKVAGTKDGITALQMDIKIDGITEEIMKVALAQASDGRAHILGEMAKGMTEARDCVNENAPRIHTMQIPKDKIREVIGSGGSVIRDICEQSEAKIDIDDDGTLKIAALNQAQTDIALKMINDIVAEPEIGEIYEGKVVKLVDFGAFVNFMGARDGLVHISEVAQERVEDMSEFFKEGDVVKVKVLEIDGRGKVRLSYKAVDQETGEDLEPDAEPRPRPQRRKSGSGNR
jgi:polyribonucleotide nucleotidyltransferase